MLRMDIPGPEGNDVRQELPKDRLNWLVLSCIVLDVVGKALYLLLMDGRESPIWCWVTVAMTLVWLAALNVRVGRPLAERSGQTWKGRIWRCHARGKEITMHCPARNPNIIEIRGLASGPLNLLIRAEGNTQITAKVQCVEHCGITGDAGLTLRSDNRIALHVSFNDGTRLEEIFSRW